MKIPLIDRQTGETIEEEVLGGGLLRLAYEWALSPLLRGTLLKTGTISRLLGWYSDTSRSRRKIEGVIDELNIDMADFEEPSGGFQTFNQWFTRRLKPGVRPFDPDPLVFSSPADCRLTVIPKLNATTAIPVKGSIFRIEDLLKTTPDGASAFQNGAVMIFRLCPVDYHRYHFPADGQTVTTKAISGRYDSVNPVAVATGIPIFTENRRVVTRMDLDTFGPTAFVEVGAFGVGGIVDTHGEGPFEKMDEKGYFRYGASTLVLVLGPGRLKIDQDLIDHSAEGMEILVRAGETLGHAP
jgi:phosphatidylserine decarboxylase